MKKNKLRALISAVPLALLVFAFGMFQVLGVDQSSATVRDFFSYLGLDNFSLLSKSTSKEGTYSINGLKSRRLSSLSWSAQWNH